MVLVPLDWRRGALLFDERTGESYKSWVKLTAAAALNAAVKAKPKQAKAVSSGV
jgi:hypothetical protein